MVLLILVLWDRPLGLVSIRTGYVCTRILIRILYVYVSMTPLLSIELFPYIHSVQIGM